MLLITKTLSSYFAGIGKPISVIISVAISLVLNVIINIILIPKYGAVGAAIATDISYTYLAPQPFIFLYQKHQNALFTIDAI